MRPTFKLRVDRMVKVVMTPPDEIKNIADTKLPDEWRKCYRNGSNEAVCLKWANECGAKINRVEVKEGKEFCFCFEFPTIESAKEFCKDFDVNCH